MAENILNAESAARERLEPELRRHVDLAIGAFDLIADVLNAAPDPIPDDAPESLYVGLALLLRVSNDLRCAMLLAQMGYPLQATSLVASMHEAAYTIPYIGNDDSLASKWRTHRQPTRPFRSVAELTRGGVEKLGGPESSTEANRVYKKYSQLCWAKHIIPFAELQISVQTHDGDPKNFSGPNTTDPGIRAAWYALEQAVWYAYVAMRSVIHFHLADRIGNTLDDPIKQLFDEYTTVHAAFLQRWGNEDPFPGQWRDISKPSKRS